MVTFFVSNFSFESAVSPDHNPVFVLKCCAIQHAILNATRALFPNSWREYYRSDH